MALLNNENLTELSECVEKLTHTGQKTLDITLLKKLKGICRLSDKYIDHAYHLVTYQLDKDHAEIRYSAFQICDELFRRSHHFRELLVSDMQHIMEVTAETSPEYPLPPPRSVALDLKRLALRTIQDWNKEFGKGYKKLQIGFNFLKHCKKVDFNALNNESLAEQARIQERERRQNALYTEKLKKITVEMDETIPEINSTITAMQNCVSLLLPMPDNFFITENNDTKFDSAQEYDINTPTQSSSNIVETHSLEKPNVYAKSSEQNSESEGDFEEVNLREYGMLNTRHTVSVNIDFNVKLKRTAENAPIFENARDLFITLNNRYLPTVKRWIQIITKAPDSSLPGQLKKVMDLKTLLENAISKCSRLKLQECVHDASSSSDSDFEEVTEKEGYEADVKEDLPILMAMTKSESGTNTDNATKSTKSWCIWSQENNKEDPTMPQSTLTALDASKTIPINSETKRNSKSKPVSTADAEAGPSTSKGTENKRKTKLLSVAPKLPFDVDLYHWEDEKVPVPTMLAVRAEGSQIWSARPSEGLDEIPVPEEMASSLRTRVIEFSGKFEPVKWACRAALSNGKLCPRKDRFKCPFHGPIVPRDELGQCSNPEDAVRLQNLAEEEQVRNPDWQDPQLLEEIKAATGIDLKMPEKGKRKKKKKKEANKYPGLTDLKKKQNTSHNRLSKKVFKKSAIKRISKALDMQDHKRFRDKYGDQFHYMYNTS